MPDDLREWQRGVRWEWERLLELLDLADVDELGNLGDEELAELLREISAMFSAVLRGLPDEKSVRSLLSMTVAALAVRYPELLEVAMEDTLREADARLERARWQPQRRAELAAEAEKLRAEAREWAAIAATWDDGDAVDAELF